MAETLRPWYYSEYRIVCFGLIFALFVKRVVYAASTANCTCNE